MFLLYFLGPDFVTSVEDGDYVYFFFREQAVEYINCGKVIFYRLKAATAAGICPSSPPQLCTTEQSKPFFSLLSYFGILNASLHFPHALNCALPRHSLGGYKMRRHCCTMSI